MATVIIGGIEYKVPPLNFVALERAWPSVEEAMFSIDPMKGPAAGIRIVAAGLCEAENFDKTQFGITTEENLDEEDTFERVVKFLKKKLLATELQEVRKCIDQITEEAGLESLSGEALSILMKEASPSPETAQDTSPSSSPPAVGEETGTP